MRTVPRALPIAVLQVLTGAVSPEAGAQTPANTQFVETYVAKGRNGLTMKLQLLKPLAALPASGWLNSADEAVADGKFGGSVKKPMQIITKPDFVVLESEKRGTISAGRYSIDEGVLTVCMWSPAPGAYRNAVELATPDNYSLCAPMELKGK